MTDNQVTQYMHKIEAELSTGKLKPQEALQRAFALGCETERMAIMHQACQEYSRARAAREAAFGNR